MVQMFQEHVAEVQKSTNLVNTNFHNIFAQVNAKLAKMDARLQREMEMNAALRSRVATLEKSNEEAEETVGMLKEQLSNLEGRVYTSEDSLEIHNKNTEKLNDCTKGPQNDINESIAGLCFVEARLMAVDGVTTGLPIFKVWTNESPTDDMDESATPSAKTNNMHNESETSGLPPPADMSGTVSPASNEGDLKHPEQDVDMGEPSGANNDPSAQTGDIAMQEISGTKVGAAAFTILKSSCRPLKKPLTCQSAKHCQVRKAGVARRSQLGKSRHVAISHLAKSWQEATCKPLLKGWRVATLK